MPILNVEIVGEPEEYPQDFAQKIADVTGDIFESRPQGTWVKLSYLPARNYAENGGVENGISPVFVSVILSSIPETPKLRVLVSELAKSVGAAAGINPENVHVIVEPPAKGRIAFGGKLVE